MSDGPLTVYDLDTLAAAPRLAVLASCDGGLSHAVAGDEVLGLAAGFLANGAAALVGPMGIVRDGAMEPLMVELHRQLGAGMAPAAALAAVRGVARDEPPTVRAAATSLICLGDGHAPAAVPEMAIRPAAPSPAPGPADRAENPRPSGRG
jgi:hypothetical protein